MRAPGSRWQEIQSGSWTGPLSFALRLGMKITIVSPGPSLSSSAIRRKPGCLERSSLPVSGSRGRAAGLLFSFPMASIGLVL
jgi:hypothetical protein